MFRRIGLIVAAFAALMLVVAPAVAQYDPQKTWEKDKKKKNNPPTNNQIVAPPPPNVPPPLVKSGPSAVKAAPTGATCVPSGFAKLSRNCNANTGACQPMRDQCNLGWCCP